MSESDFFCEENVKHSDVIATGACPQLGWLEKSLRFEPHEDPGREMSGRRNKCKGPEAGIYLVCLKKKETPELE